MGVNTTEEVVARKLAWMDGGVDCTPINKNNKHKKQKAKGNNNGNKNMPRENKEENAVCLLLRSNSYQSRT